MSTPTIPANDTRPSLEGLYYVQLDDFEHMFLVDVYKHGVFLYAKTLGKRNIDPLYFNKVHSVRTTEIDGTWYGPLPVPATD